MPVTVRGTDILFNDGTTQTRSAFPALAAGSTFLGEGRAATTSTSYVVSTAGVALAAGTIRTRFRAEGGYAFAPGNGYDISNREGSTIAEARIFINGVGVGSLVTSPNGSNSAVSQQDFTVAAGDLIQVGVRRVSSSGSLIPNAGITAQFGGGSVFQIASFVIRSAGAFTI